MKTVDEIRKMADTANKCRDFRKVYTETVEKQTCDKYDFSFNGDGRFSMFETPISVDAYRGYYGNSSCSSFDLGDEKILTAAFISYLNSHKWEIIKEMGEKIMQEAIKLKSEALAEIDKLREGIDTLGEPPPSSPEGGVR